ncbi:hypothetical protein BGZ60DRAFT_403158 [Tricladium varicosporioides]|nr:hypothetical protein BGZ60DRAFT_403158 [Hymenoscyphus varicosporioides]
MSFLPFCQYITSHHIRLLRDNGDPASCTHACPRSGMHLWLNTTTLPYIVNHLFTFSHQLKRYWVPLRRCKIV